MKTVQITFTEPLLGTLSGNPQVTSEFIVSKHPEAERRIQELRIEGILKRAGSDDQRFSDFASTRVCVANS